MAKHKVSPSPEPTPARENYTVLARRYRPQQFAELVGQEPAAQALINALKSNRVAHAYLFTGARGVGKTSTARILAKALNCEHGPTPTPCDQCDICQRITAGEDVDVLEIDGASNRRIDEIRDIRNNVHFRPSRARYKIYIIDEVHMLTKEAFNALLKTLEEPPPHVKFIFATTEVDKVPITILSRCQRFDFAGIGTERIVQRLREIAAKEKVEADDEALELVARRAGGSMRDAQSLLDQLLAFGGDQLTADQVHQLLGTATDDRILALAAAILNHDAVQALDVLGKASDEGLNLGEVLEQLIAYWRDLMLLACGGGDAVTLNVAPRHRATLAKQAQTLPLDTILAGLDILAAARARMQRSNHGRVLAEMAVVRLGRLDNLVSLEQLGQLLRGQPASATTPARPAPARLTTPVAPPEGEKKKPLPTPEPSASGPPPLTEASLPATWAEILAQAGFFHANHLRAAGLPAILGPNTLVMRFPPGYNEAQEYCLHPDRIARIEGLLRQVVGSAWKIRVEASPAAGTSEASPPAVEVPPPPARPKRQRSDILQLPLLRHAVEKYGGQVMQMDDAFGLEAPTPVAASEPDGDEPDTEET